MPLSLSQKRILILAGLLLCVGILLAFVYLLPFYLETRLLPRWAKDAGLDPQVMRMRRIGLSGTDTGPIRLNIGTRSFAEVDAVQINYSPASLALGRINGIVLSGLKIFLTLNDAGDAIAGWHPPESVGPAADQALQVADLPKRVPVGLNYLKVHNALVTVFWRGRSLEIPLEMDLDTGKLDQGRLQAAARLSLRGAPLHLNAEVETGANSLRLEAACEALEIARFSDILALFTDSPIGGRLDLNTQARCRLQPPAITAMLGEARLTGANLALAGGRITHRPHPEGQTTPLGFQWTSEDGRTYSWSLGAFDYHGPARFQVNGSTGQLIIEPHGWRAETTTHILLPAQSLASGGPAPSINQPLGIDATFSVLAESGKTLQWQLYTPDSAGMTEDRFHLRQGEWQMQSHPPRIEAEGQILDGAVSGRGRVKLTALSARNPTAEVLLPDLILDGRFEPLPQPALHATLTLSGLQAKFGDAAINLPKIQLTSELAGNARSWSATGELVATGGLAQYDSQDIRLQDITLRLPVRYPLEPQSPAGDVGIGQMVWRSRPIGSVRGKAGLDASGLWAELRHASKLFPGLNVQMHSELGQNGVALDISVPATKPTAVMDLGRILPAAEGLRFQGQFKAQAEVRAKGDIIQSRGRIQIDQGALRHDVRQLNMEGIACDLHLEDLMNLRSQSRQQLQVADLSLGKLAARHLRVDFQLEPRGTLFIEKAGVQWCKGSMQTQAFRLTPGRDEVEVTVYCDRLNLAMLLEQLGAAQGSGEGTVNGRIPLSWKEGMLRFDNGFLYSTPGQTGTIRLSGTEALLEGLASGSPQHVQLDIASEALKDYSYNWAKVDLRSEEDLLLVSLKLDGKPNRPLPFAYDPQSGVFKRFSGQGQAEFQGINIDLNFKTPLREILHYRQLMAPKN